MIELKILRSNQPADVDDLDETGLFAIVRSARDLISQCSRKLRRQELPPTNQLLGVRAARVCRRLGVFDLRQLTCYTAEDVLAQHNSGVSTLLKIREVLSLYDLSLKGEQP